MKRKLNFLSYFDSGIHFEHEIPDQLGNYNKWIVSELVNSIFFPTETNFLTISSKGCLQNILHDILNETKLLFELILPSDYLQLRGKCNIFECLGKGPSRCFQNRSALKLVSLDHTFEVLNNGKSTFAFADICGGPGGFVEYILLKNISVNRKTIGFGISLTDLKADNSICCTWKLQHLHNPPDIAIISEYSPSRTICNSICQFYVLSGEDGSGNILRRQNVDSFSSYVNNKMKTHELSCKESDFINSSILNGDYTLDNNDYSTQNSDPLTINANHKVIFPRTEFEFTGVDLVTADGGSDEGRHSLQHETIFLKLLYCEIIAMLGTLNEGGTFILKIFSSHETKTMEILVLLSSLFRCVSLHKPVTSRPISSEQYLICVDLHHMTVQSRMLLGDSLWSRYQLLLQSDEQVQTDLTPTSNRSSGRSSGNAPRPSSPPSPPQKNVPLYNLPVAVGECTTATTCFDTSYSPTTSSSSSSSTITALKDIQQSESCAVEDLTMGADSFGNSSLYTNTTINNSINSNSTTSLIEPGDRVESDDDKEKKKAQNVIHYFQAMNIKHLKVQLLACLRIFCMAKEMYDCSDFDQMIEKLSRIPVVTGDEELIAPGNSNRNSSNINQLIDFEDNELFVHSSVGRAKNDKIGCQLSEQPIITESNKDVVVEVEEEPDVEEDKRVLVLGDLLKNGSCSIRASDYYYEWGLYDLFK